ncbi:MAG: putative toxin-antitoxin system toxin component, PIN family [Firmicutes bacterium]|nr:putative toxin-antitoxin system toxin component, PIN family [Bacillota bacterium]
MGKKKPIRVVLDTNIIISALLFDSFLSEIVNWWKTNKIIPLISKETFDELVKVLTYPKFSLTEKEIKSILEDEILPYFEIVTVKKKIMVKCRDTEDEKFVQCAVSGKADFVISGDKDLCSMGNWKFIQILSWTNFLKITANTDR